MIGSKYYGVLACRAFEIHSTGEQPLTFSKDLAKSYDGHPMGCFCSSCRHQILAFGEPVYRLFKDDPRKWDLVRKECIDAFLAELEKARQAAPSN